MQENAISKHLYLLKAPLFLQTKWSMISFRTASPQEWTLHNGNQQFNHRLTFIVKWQACMVKQTQDNWERLIRPKDLPTILIQILFRARLKLCFHRIQEVPVERAQPLRVLKAMRSPKKAPQSKISLRLSQAFLGILKTMKNLGLNKLSKKTGSFPRILRNPSTSSAKST